MLSAVLIATSSVLFASSQQLAAASTAACRAPVSVRVEQIDPRFNLSREEAAEVTRRAASLWNSLRNNAVSVESNGQVPISFVYDERQVKEQEIQSQRSSLEKEITEFNSLAASVRLLANQLTALQGIQKQKTEVYDLQQRQYESDVKALNAHGGGTPTQVAAFESRYAALLAEQSVLNKKTDQINLIVNALNAISNTIRARQVVLQSEITAFNTKIKNEPNPEAGLYTENANGRRIQIFAYQNMLNLERLLAHELGHALGLEHVATADAVMHAVNIGEDKTLSLADIEEFSRVCN